MELASYWSVVFVVIMLTLFVRHGTGGEAQPVHLGAEVPPAGIAVVGGASLGRDRRSSGWMIDRQAATILRRNYTTLKGCRHGTNVRKVREAFPGAGTPSRQPRNNWGGSGGDLELR